MPERLFELCIPIRETAVPAGRDCIHEIMHDGYRLIVQRDVRLFTCNGHDWTDHYPWIVQAALQNRQMQFVIDGEAVILGVDGNSGFEAMYSGKYNEAVRLYAFDMLAGDGDDMRKLPLSMRKTNLARLLARRPEGIFVSDFEEGEIGPDLFRKACEFGIKGLVSKHRDRAYRPGRSPDWVKVKNPIHPAMTRSWKLSNEKRPLLGRQAGAVSRFVFWGKDMRSMRRRPIGAMPATNGPIGFGSRRSRQGRTSQPTCSKTDSST